MMRHMSDEILALAGELMGEHPEWTVEEVLAAADEIWPMLDEYATTWDEDAGITRWSLGQYCRSWDECSFLMGNWDATPF